MMDILSFAVFFFVVYFILLACMTCILALTETDEYASTSTSTQPYLIKPIRHKRRHRRRAYHPYRPYYPIEQAKI